MCQPSSPVSASLAGAQEEIGRHRLDRLEVERSGRAADRACAARPACRADPRRRRRSGGAAGRARPPPPGRDCRAAPSSPDRGDRVRRAGRPGTPPRVRAEQSGRSRSGAAASTPPRPCSRLTLDRLGDRRRVEAAVARFVETFGELRARCAARPASANISSICSSTWTASERGRSATKSSASGASSRWPTRLAAPSPPRSACSRVQRSSASARAGAAAASASAVSAGASSIGRLRLGDRAVIRRALRRAAGSFRVPVG